MTRFKRPIRRSDTFEVSPSNPISASNPPRRRLGRWALVACLATSAVAGVPPMHPARFETLPGPRVAVASAAPAVSRDAPVLIGGFTDRLEATAAVQVRDPRLGWLPIGNALLEARAEATAIPLDDEEILVIGGWTGILPHDRRWLGSAERIHPRRPHLRVDTPPPLPERATDGLEGHVACRLHDGRVLLVHDHAATVFDPATNLWSKPSPLEHPRRDAVLVPIETDAPDVAGAVIIGGGGDASIPAIETLHVASDAIVTATPWLQTGPPPNLRHIAAGIHDGTILLAGGDDGRRSTCRTWLLDPSDRTCRPGPDLPLPAGVTRAALVPRDQRWTMIGGECLVDGRPSPSSCAVVLDPDRSLAWRLPPIPDAAVRSTVFVGPDGDLEVIGGYRFRDHGPGPRSTVLSTNLRLRLPSLLVAD